MSLTFRLTGRIDDILQLVEQFVKIVNFDDVLVFAHSDRFQLLDLNIVTNTDSDNFDSFFLRIKKKSI